MESNFEQMTVEADDSAKMAASAVDDPELRPPQPCGIR